jgi:hypothetical protein
VIVCRGAGRGPLAPHFTIGSSFAVGHLALGYNGVVKLFGVLKFVNAYASSLSSTKSDNDSSHLFIERWPCSSSESIEASAAVLIATNPHCKKPFCR